MKAAYIIENDCVIAIIKDATTIQGGNYSNNGSRFSTGKTICFAADVIKDDFGQTALVCGRALKYSTAKKWAAKAEWAAYATEHNLNGMQVFTC